MTSTSDEFLDVFFSGQAPEDNQEGGQRDGEDHPRDSAERGAPEEDGDDDHDGVKTGPVKEVIEKENPSLKDVPVLKTWPGDGGPFITLPLVFCLGGAASSNALPGCSGRSTAPMNPAWP